MLIGLDKSQIDINVVSKSKEHGNVQQEIDVIVNNNGRLIIFDCKLKDVDSESDAFITHIKASHDTTQMLGGLNAQCVMIRPNRIVNDEEKLIASAWRVKILGLSECKNLFTEIGKIIQINPPEDMLAVEQLYLNDYSIKPILVPIKESERLMADDQHILRINSIQTYFQRVNCWENIGWVSIEVGSNIWIIRDVFCGIKDFNRTDKRIALVNMLTQICDNYQITISKTGISWYAIIFINNDDKRKAFNIWIDDSATNHNLL